MKKEMMFFALILFLIINLSFIFAAEDLNISKEGYDCLKTKVEGKCSSLAPEEKIFSLLALGQCKDELVEDSYDGECWPKSGCKIKTTAQAMLALRENSGNVDKPLTWLLDRESPTTQLQWYVQIDSNKPVKCKVSYSGKSYNVEIDTEKKINSPAGSCLGLSDGDYWFEVSPTCYEQDFEISCNESFITSLLYKTQASSTVFVSEQMHSSSADGTITEKVESLCFKEGTSCSYEGTLWASLILKKLKQNTTAYIPYLISMAEENSRYLPEAFLYILVGESYRNEILLKQRESQWWLESEDKFFDTAFALYPFQYEELIEKTNSINWLGEIQGTDGCWQGNIRNTAFLLYSIWPKKAQLIEGQKDCEEGNYCMSAANCRTAGGTELSDFSGCFGAANICCSKQYLAPTCGAQGGEKCPSDKICSNGEPIPSSDLVGSEKCCLKGTCQTGEQIATCGRSSGTCRTSCLSTEEETQYTCNGNEACCVIKTTPPTNYTGIIIFSILIVLVVLGIIFRKKLKMLVDKITKKSPGTGTPSPFGQQRPGPFGPGSMPPSTPSGMPQRMMPRRILPSQPPQQPRRPLPPRKQEGEFSEVLRKLKEMGK